MTYRDILSGDQRYVSARLTNQSDRGWAFEPTVRRRPSLYGSAIKGFIGLVLAIGSAWAFALAIMQ